MYSGSCKITIHMLLGLWVQQLGQPFPLGPGVPLDLEFGIKLVDVLPDAALGEEQLFGDLPVAQALGRQLGQGVFPVRQGG